MKSKHSCRLRKTLSRVRFTRLAPLALALTFPLALLLVVASCTSVPMEGATLVLSVEDPYASKTLVPGIDMTAAEYDFTGSGPNGGSFAVTKDNNPASVTSLEPGVWTVDVTAKNANDTIIARGQKTVTLNPGQTKTVTVTITTISGYGSLDVNVAWNVSDIYDPSILAQLIPATGSPITLAVAYPAAGAGKCTGSDIPTGYYTLVIQLFDGTTPVMGSVEVVRIIDKNTTLGTYQFLEINQAKGSIAVNITPKMNDPIDVKIAGQVEEIVSGASMTVNASVPPDTGNVVYVWYVNGVSKGTGSSFSFGGALDVGIYRLDVSAFTIDGERAGSVSHVFRVKRPA